MNTFLIQCFTFLLLITYNITAQNNTEAVIGSANEWPMSGGPNGNYKITTNKDVPLKWSVRTGENIKWKKTLPEGGQSGIAVWGYKLFLTINPPNTNPKHKDVLKKYDVVKNRYEFLFKKEEEKLKKIKDLSYANLKENLAEPLKKWQNLLKNNSHYQKASSLERYDIKKNLMRKNDVGKDYAIFNNKLVAYIHTQSQNLQKTYDSLIKIGKDKRGGASSKNIILLCLNANTGETLWEKTIKGTFSSQYNYGFSDATTPCPMTDGKNVWAINASGGMACFSMEGELVWERTWEPSSGGKPFNKQFDSVLFEDLILNVEPPEKEDKERNKDWNYVHAFNKLTGERVWVTKMAITHYNTPIIGKTKEGKPALLIGRGGPHGVPERPIGLSLICLEKNNAGNALWNWEPKENNALAGWGALSTQHWDIDKASWFYKGNEHITVDTQTGKLISEKKLNTVDQFNYDIEKGKYVLSEEVKIKELQNQRHCNILDGDYLFYMVRYSPFIARHNVATGLNEHIEVPRDIDRDNNFIWKIQHTNNGLNSKGQLNAFDTRTRGNGFQKCFLGSPTMINNYIFFTNAVGMVYVIDATVEEMNESALVAVNDLGKSGKTWTVNTMSYANGKIYHRTMKEVICISE
ncbi:putative pyrroloquinoline-quinone binding quinoprotein [Maribacter vaceletii]|uniref:Putative pyrroloquinoline-quinone binding quinoprotein n=1 Tax=Maribacter vaceletii TaxID=1206816 RepID=A0A495E5U3_9FLAO|nr:PQQ-binding-like beta-propeller repeat protein [Maribacter vaceletii]RKR12166.1 putative pyrroloquinoline-quinone binding quinoprotein [Maribacter vaceletii]